MCISEDYHDEENV